VKLALGTAQFGMDYGVANPRGRVPREEAASILAAARQSGIDILDTAIAYGASESRLGEIGIADWRVVTKLPPAAGISDVQAWVHESVRESLRRLRVERLYALLLHRPSELHRPYGSALRAALLELKSRGLVSKLGVSIYAPEELVPVFDALQPDIVQAPFNILDRRLAESGWLDRLVAENVEVHTRSAFLQGLLLMPPQVRPSAFDRWIETWRAWVGWLDDTGLAPVEACLGFVLTYPQIERVVVGVDSLQQLRELLAAMLKNVPRAPDYLAVSDVDLIDPSRWKSMQLLSARGP
jgi:aryl-alcohol dehydrogenase-like predicted oxidoreductase